MADTDFKPTDEELAALGKAKDEELDDLDIAEIERIRADADENRDDDDDEDSKDDDANADDDKDDYDKDDDEHRDPVDKKPKGAENQERQPSRREAKRIQDLLGKYGDPTNEPSNQSSTSQKAIDYAKEIDADPELIKRLEADRDATIQATRQQGETQQNMLAFETRLDIDAPRVESKYPILDPNSDKFDDTAAEGVYALYRDLSQYDAKNKSVGNPAFRYAPFADALMTLAKRLAADETEQANKNITKRASRTGLRPDGSSTKTKTKDPLKMSDEEFNKFIGII